MENTNKNKKLAAVATGGGGGSEVVEVGLGIKGEIDEEELLGVDGKLEGEVGELEVDAEEDAAGEAKPHDADVVARDGRACEALGEGDERGEELEDHEVGVLGHGFSF
jgi:hypothetical protein